MNPYIRKPNPAYSKPNATGIPPADEQIISEILSTENFYIRLGVARDAPTELVRRAYLRRSKVCHPDRQSHPLAKEAFQRLNDAYSTISDPNHRRQYDMYGKRVNGSEQTFADALQQVIDEFLEGHYDTLMSIIDHIQSLNPELRISKEGARHVLSSMRDFCLWSGKCWSALKFEIITLYEIHSDIQSLSYFDVRGRLCKAARLSKGLISLMAKIVPVGGYLIEAQIPMVERVEVYLFSSTTVCR
ncbi:uncharacterized protein EV422DRAFT_515066 [Fimicolochytrium jonesii]|uniref:uncharacterized protein n=1 Tax=Fimicolochytrium jonesii TaxID=1396493 RepID=UPI0022FE9DE1|nr:uncharacterized protein EV422DRAFT_515066 [Fimicolochytrium jonesii]KAI8826035.1 hypothetical protein EV422DRAFT_515066 [Fimicolochytrium jonesii]